MSALRRRPPGLTRRLIAASGLLALVVGGAFAVLLVAIDDLRDAARRTDHSQDVLVAANELERLLLDLETGQRGFVLTRQERFLGPWHAARAEFPTRSAQLVKLVSVDPHEARRVARIARDERAYIDDYSVPLVAAARRGAPSARTTAATDDGKRRVDAMRVQFDRLLDTERRRSAASSASADDAARRASTAAAIGIAGSIGLIALYAGFLTRAIVRPIRQAAAMATRIAGGDLSARMPQTGPGEVGVLERTFNVMAGSLERSRGELAELAAEQAALRRVATHVAQGAPPPTVFAAVAEEVGRLLAADLSALGRYDPDETLTVVASWSATGDDAGFGERLSVEEGGVARLVLDTAGPARIDRYAGAAAQGAARLGIRSSVAAPITVESRLWGLIVVASSGDEPSPPDAERRLADFGELVATAIANAESQAELTASRARIVATADETRRRIERDLHDGAQQRLVSLALQLRGAQAAVPAGLEEVETELADIATGLTDVLDELREMARGIHPAILAQGGLGPALRTLARRSMVPVDLDVRAEGRLPEAVEVGAYYVVSEALTNAAKHAHATLVAVDVERVDGSLRVSVRDDGVGGATVGQGSGLVGLKDRVEALGGRIAIESPPEAGTAVRVELPLVDEPPPPR